MERWRPVPDLEGLYEVSSIGSVRSIDRIIHCSDGDHRKYRGRILSPEITKDGYRRVNMKRARFSVRMFVHAIVAAAFIGPRPRGMLCLHKDDDKSNNCFRNLYYGTRYDNAADSITNGRQHHGSRIRQSKLTEGDIPQILALRGSGFTYRAIGDIYHVTPQAIFHVCKGSWWKRCIPQDQMPRAGAVVPPRRA